MPIKRGLLSATDKWRERKGGEAGGFVSSEQLKKHFALIQAAEMEADSFL
jgi:hypothetical protein